MAQDCDLVLFRGTNRSAGSWEGEAHAGATFLLGSSPEGSAIPSRVCQRWDSSGGHTRRTLASGFSKEMRSSKRRTHKEENFPFWPSQLFTHGQYRLKLWGQNRWEPSAEGLGAGAVRGQGPRIKSCSAHSCKCSQASTTSPSGVPCL